MSLHAHRHARIVVLNVRTTVVEAARAMRTNEVGAILVTDRDGLAGIVTDRDLALRVVAEGLDPYETRLGDVMSRGVATLPPDADEGDALELMTRGRLRRVPIVDGDRVVGIVTLDDLVFERAIGLDDVAAVVRAQIVEAGPARTNRYDEWRALERRHGRAMTTWNALVADVAEESGLRDREDIERAIELVLGTIVRRIDPALAERLTARLPALVLAHLHALPRGPDRAMTRGHLEREIGRAFDVPPRAAAAIVGAVGRGLRRHIHPADAVGRRLPPDLASLLGDAADGDGSVARDQ